MKNEWSLFVKNLAPWCPNRRPVWEALKTWYELKEKESRVTTNKQTRQIPMMPGHWLRGEARGGPAGHSFKGLVSCVMSLGVRPGCYLSSTSMKPQRPLEHVTKDESFLTLGTIWAIWAILPKSLEEMLTCWSILDETDEMIFFKGVEFALK